MIRADNIYFNNTEVSKIYYGTNVTLYTKDLHDYLCFTSLQDGSTFRIYSVQQQIRENVELEYSTDKGNWFPLEYGTYDSGGTVVTLNAGQKAWIRGDNDYISYATNDGYINSSCFECYGSFNLSGNIMSLMDKTCELNTLGLVQGMGYQSFGYLFAPKRPSNVIKTVPSLPATSISKYAYDSMFEYCTGITTPALLPATTLGEGCYHAMYYNCTNLEKLPSIRALTYPNNACWAMFANCSKIKLSETQGSTYTNAYRIPITGSGTGSTAFTNMFNGTGGTFTGTPIINTTYYTSNEII